MIMRQPILMNDIHKRFVIYASLYRVHARDALLFLEVFEMIFGIVLHPLNGRCRKRVLYHAL